MVQKIAQRKLNLASSNNKKGFLKGFLGTDVLAFEIVAIVNRLFFNLLMHFFHLFFQVSRMANSICESLASVYL